MGSNSAEWGRARMLALADQLDWRARSARKESRSALSAASRFQMQGRADMAEEIAATLRRLGNRYDDD